KGTVKGIRRSLQDGLLGDAENIRVARTQDGPLEPLKQFPEFRDLVVQPGKLPTVQERGSDPLGKKPAATAPISQAADAPATGDSATLRAATVLAALSRAAPKEPNTTSPQGPCINLKARGSTLNADVMKWLVFGLLFAGAGALVTLY